MGAELKAIETRYKGYRFRSRLEARWAVFFDALGIEWEYEKEGYDLGDAGWYLPDFWLPEYEILAEVKPYPIPEADRESLPQIATALVKTGPFLILRGVPQAESTCFLFTPHPTAGMVMAVGCLGFHDTSIGMVLPNHNWDPDLLPDDRRSTWLAFRGPQLMALEQDSLVPPVLHRAYVAARSARFEHGEQG